jgi:hypothetical protein
MAHARRLPRDVLDDITRMEERADLADGVKRPGQVQ